MILKYKRYESSSEQNHTPAKFWNSTFLILDYTVHIAFAGNGYNIGNKQSIEESKINESRGMCEYGGWAASSIVLMLVLQ